VERPTALSARYGNEASGDRGIETKDADGSLRPHGDVDASTRPCPERNRGLENSSEREPCVLPQEKERAAQN